MSSREAAMATTIGDNAVVIDYDDDFIRAGYAVPEREPGVLQPALVRPAGSGAGGESSRPIRDRRVEDWDQLEALLADVFYRQCAWVKGDEGACLITEPMFTSKADRERLTQMMFESFNVSGLYVAEQPVAALYAVGKVTGVSVDVGYSVTDVAPVVEGSLVSPAAQRCEAGHSLVTAELIARCGEEHRRLREHERDAVRDATAAVTPSRDDASGDDVPLRDETYTLPDGRKVSVPGAARRECVERGLFRPSSRAGLVDAAAAAIAACPAEQRRAVVDAVGVCGAWAGRTEGLDARILADLEQQLPPSMKPFLASTPEYMPAGTARWAPWIGGAILSKVVFTHNQHVTKVEYQETGPSVAAKLKG